MKTNQCRACGEFSVVYYDNQCICTQCDETYSINNKKINNKSKPYDNKNTHFANVLRNLHNNTVDKNYINELNNLIDINKLDENDVNPTFVSEFLKKKKIKNYILTYGLTSACNFKINFTPTDLKNIIIIFKYFLNFYSKLYIKKKPGTISCEYIFYEIFNIIKNTNIKNSKNNKNEHEIVWNDFLIHMYEDKFTTVTNSIEWKPHHKVLIHSYNNIKMINI